MGTRIRSEISLTDINDYRRIYAAALTIQKDGRGRYYMTPELVEDRMSKMDDDVITTDIEIGRDPVEEATRDALKYRRFTLDEVRKFKTDFDAYLCEKLEWLGKLTPEAFEEYSKPCTIKRIKEELSYGNTGEDFVRILYLSHVGWIGLED